MKESRKDLSAELVNKVIYARYQPDSLDAINAFRGTVGSDQSTAMLFLLLLRLRYALTQ